MYKNSNENMARVLGTKVTLICDGVEAGTNTVAEVLQTFLMVPSMDSFGNLFDAIAAVITSEEVEYSYNDGTKSIVKKVADDSN